MKKFLLLSLHILVSFSSFCMDLPLAVGIQSLPKELFVLIGASDDGLRDTLRSVCRFCSQKLSIKSPNLQELVAQPSFCTNPKTLQYLAFNAAWDGNSDLLKSLMRLMGQPDYRYQYQLANKLVSNFDFERIITMKMPDKYDEIAETAMLYNCNLNFYFHANTCNSLKMACFNKNAVLLDELLVQVGKRNDVDLDNLLYISIDKDSDKCLNVLLSYVKNNIEIWNKNTSSSCKIYQDILEVAMEGKKYKAFESLVANNVLCDLNFAYQLADGRNFTILDWIIDYVNRTQLPDGDTFIKIYKKYDGKRYSELNRTICHIQ